MASSIAGCRSEEQKNNIKGSSAGRQDGELGRRRGFFRRIGFIDCCRSEWPILWLHWRLPGATPISCSHHPVEEVLMHRISALALSLALILGLAAIARAEENKEVTLKGTITCAQCGLKKETACA